MPELLHTAVFGLPPARCGKVREVYDLGDELLIVATDRISAFDVNMANGIPDKGRILTQMSAFWFRFFGDTVPHHVISTDDAEVQARCPQPQPELAGRATVAKKAKPMPVECVARGYLTGSLYKEYLEAGGASQPVSLYGFDFPAGLVDATELPSPIFTPATKAEEGHDENISFDRVIDMIGAEAANYVRETTLRVYAEASRYAKDCGVILADTKFEFGWTEDGIIWIDEALTPDSSRFWDAAVYQPGASPPSFDKQYVRNYLLTSGWDRQPPGPMLPADIVNGTRARYLEAYARLTGSPFEA